MSCDQNRKNLHAPHVHPPGYSMDIFCQFGIVKSDATAERRAYADAIKALAADDALREKYGENARRRVEENFTNGIFKNNVTKLMETL